MLTYKEKNIFKPCFNIQKINGKKTVFVIQKFILQCKP